MSGPSPHLCRCGSYSAILDAVQRAATLMEGQVAMDIITNVHGATLSRRQFVKTGGALVVGFTFVGCRMLETPGEGGRRQELARRRAHQRRGSRSTPTTPS